MELASNKIKNLRVGMSFYVGFSVAFNQRTAMPPSSKTAATMAAHSIAGWRSNQGRLSGLPVYAAAGEAAKLR